MSLLFPYTYVSCPCSDGDRRTVQSKRQSREVRPEEDADDEEKTFDPSHPRSAFSLFPPEHLLYCEECQDIKCPRCVTEEIICWYCPSCLFETPSSMVKSEGNRCARNCFNCPICTSQMITASISNAKDGPFILNCNYCMWTTLDIGITFEKPTNLRQQLDKIANGGFPKQASKFQEEVDASRKSSLAQDAISLSGGPGESDTVATSSSVMDETARFKALRSFYKDQITAVSTGDTGLPASALDLAYSSPSSLTRIMNLYSNMGSSGLRKARPKPTVMREALTQAEGLQVSDPNPAPIVAYSDTTSTAQRMFQHPSYLGNPAAHSVSALRPMPALLRTKRSKRCATCKHILVKPEFKPTSTRYRIKLIALNYIPFATLKPLPVSGGLRPPTDPDGGDVVMRPGKAAQFILTLKNPQFENMHVSLGCPSETPGRHAHKVTILCPQFEIGKSGDVWDDALNSPLNQSIMGSRGGEQIAGRLYDQGRNWASVVIEVLPATTLLGLQRELEEDEDVIEVPIRVRLEWKISEEDGDRLKMKKSEKALEEASGVDDGTREVSYWMVLGVGRVATKSEES